MRGHVLAAGAASQPQPPVERQHEGFGGGLGDSFAVGLGAIAGACVGRGSGQPRMPPRERQHEGFGGGWGILLRLDWELLRGHGLTTGVVRHACRHRVTARGVLIFWFGGFLCGWTGSRCGSMCWPVDRPATHAAAGAAARGVLVFGLGDSFTRPELGNDTGLMGALLPFVLRACCGGMCWPRERPANRSRRWSGSTRG